MNRQATVDEVPDKFKAKIRQARSVSLSASASAPAPASDVQAVMLSSTLMAMQATLSGQTQALSGVAGILAEIKDELKKKNE